MIHEYIAKYVAALKKNDKAEMDRIEKALAKVGMDKMTLEVLVEEFLETAKKYKQTDQG